MSRARCIGIFLVAAALCAGGAADARPAKQPRRLFQLVAAATGGSAWDAVGESRAVGELSAGGLHGPVRVFTDLKTGRSASYFDLGAESGGNGFDGVAAWEQDASRQVRMLDAPDSRSGAVSDAYVARNGWFHPDRDPAQFRYLGPRQENGRAFDLVRVLPRYGRAIEVWIDGATHRIDRLVTRLPTLVQTVRLADYRVVGGLFLPFRTEVDNGDRKDRQVQTLTHCEIVARAAEADFARPVSQTTDARIVSGGAATVAITIEAGHILVDATIDGQGPFPFLFDTGGRNVVTPDMARRLGLKGEGAAQVGGVGEGKADIRWTRVGRLRLGDAELENQQFLILPLPSVIVDRGALPPVAGLVGYEILKRFVTELDYASRRITFRPAEGFTYAGSGAGLPFGFADTTPQVTARLDGIEGQFDLDTGDGSSLTLLDAFVAAHRLKSRYQHGISVSSAGGIGGPVTGYTTRVAAFELAGYRIDRPIAEFVAPRSGAFSSTTLAGNIGYDILSRFVITFDYERQRIYLSPGADFTRPPRYNRSGLSLTKLAAKRFSVLGIAARSPAAIAGIAAGDAIEAVDGRSGAGLRLADVQAVLEQPAGTRVRLTLTGQGGARTVDLTLADLLP